MKVLCAWVYVAKKKNSLRFRARRGSKPDTLTGGAVALLCFSTIYLCMRQEKMNCPRHEFSGKGNDEKDSKSLIEYLHLVVANTATDFKYLLWYHTQRFLCIETAQLSFDCCLLRIGRSSMVPASRNSIGVL